MGDIVIVGAGFAGLEAARVLSGRRTRLGNRRIIVVDKKATSDFLPVLPDVCGEFVPSSHVCLELAEYFERLKVNFENDEAVKINISSREVMLQKGGVLSYEFLILACGSVTNFYGQKGAEGLALKLDSSEDARVILNTVKAYPSKPVVIIGGGYTGVEIASNLAMFFKRRKIKKYSINLVERSEDILVNLPQWVRDYCRINLAALRVNVYADTFIKEIAGKRILLSSGMEFSDCIMIWAAGVHTPLLISGLECEKDRQGRIVVDQYLRFSDSCFAIGDAASFRNKDRPLRMAVQFSLAEADNAASNILRIIAGKKRLTRYRPLDFGLLLPMANRKACGRVLFFRIWGIIGWFLHYAMCIFRSYGIRNKLGILSDSLLRLFR